MIEQSKVDILVGLINRGRITLEDIKDLEYRAAVEAELVR
jgi:hypothetical protein